VFASTSIGVPVNPEWWNNELPLRDLPGGPLQVSYDSGHRAGISRCALFELAAMNLSSDGILRLLWHTLAWGGGRKARLMNKRLDSVASNPEFAARPSAPLRPPPGRSPPMRMRRSTPRAEPCSSTRDRPSSRSTFTFPVAERRHTRVPSWIACSRRTFAPAVGMVCDQQVGRR
jgi:hypothetical protein